MFFSLFAFSLIAVSWASSDGLINTNDSLGVSFLAAEYQSSTSGGYHVYGKANWYMAQEVCNNVDMRFVRINDQHKNDELTYFIGDLTAVTGPYWTVANRLYDESTWSFSAVDDPVKYFNWAAGEPNNVGENEKCIEIYRDGQWNDQDCGEERFVLCESKTNNF